MGRPGRFSQSSFPTLSPSPFYLCVFSFSLSSFAFPFSYSSLILFFPTLPSSSFFFLLFSHLPFFLPYFPFIFLFLFFLSIALLSPPSPRPFSSFSHFSTSSFYSIFHHSSSFSLLPPPSSSFNSLLHITPFLPFPPPLPSPPWTQPVIKKYSF